MFDPTAAGPNIPSTTLPTGSSFAGAIVTSLDSAPYADALAVITHEAREQINIVDANSGTVIGTITPGSGIEINDLDFDSNGDIYYQAIYPTGNKFGYAQYTRTPGVYSPPTEIADITGDLGFSNLIFVQYHGLTGSFTFSMLISTARAD
ncbi:MAG TPA: hypothetical protein VGB30_03950 [bacterium]|jgi:hypothetical protein